MEEICICFVGDSQTNGTGDASHIGWPGRVRAAAENEERKVTQYNLGIREESSADIFRQSGSRSTSETLHRVPAI